MFNKATNLFVVLAFLAAPIGAAPMYFSDRVTFDATTGGALNFEGFEGAWTDSSGVAVFADFSVSETGGNNSLYGGTEAGGAGFSTTEGTNSLWYDDNGSSIGSFSFGTAVTAFGLDISIYNFSGGGSATVTIGGGSLSDSILLNDKSPQFWGVIDAGGINSVNFARSGSNGIGFDAVSYGNAVPTPATLALMGLGLAGLGWKRRKQA